MSGPTRNFLGICIATALGLLAAPTALASPGTTLSGYVDTSANLVVNGKNTSTAGEAFSNMLVKVNNGTATACTPAPDCTAGGQFAQFDFFPPVPPGGSFMGTINTVPAPYSGTIDVKIFVNGGGELDLPNLPVGSTGATALNLPAIVMVDPKTGKGRFDATWSLSQDATFSGGSIWAPTGLGHKHRCPGPIPHSACAGPFEVGTISDTHIAAGETQVPLTAQLENWLRRVTRGKGSGSRGLVRGVYAFFRNHDVEVKGTLGDSSGSTPFEGETKLVFKGKK